MPADMSTNAPAGGGEWITWLSHSVLLLVGSFVEEVPGTDRGGDAALAGMAMRFAASDAPDAGLRMLAAVVVPEQKRSRLSDGLDILVAGHVIRLDGSRIAAAQTDLSSLLRESGLAAAPPAVRASAVALLASTARSAADPARLSRSLNAIREALRDRLPQRDRGDESLALQVDALAAIDAQTFYIKGRYAEAIDVAELAIVSPEGSRIVLHDRAVTYSIGRPGGDGGRDHGRALGFSACFTTDAPSCLPAPWIVELRDAGDLAEEVIAPPVLRDPIAIRDLLLEDLRNEPGLDDVLLERHVAPALKRLHPRRNAGAAVVSVRHCGPRPSAPEISVLVALGEETECLEQHLAQFADDDAMRNVELIYAIDPRMPARPFCDVAERLAELYRVPFTLVMLRSVVDAEPIALQAASTEARGRLLVFLDRRTLPAAHGWVRAMQACHDRTPGIGALTPKLLYVDDLIRSAGAAFRRREQAGRWVPVPQLRGVPRGAAAARVSQPVMGVSSGCLMIGADLFAQVGGFRGAFVRAEYEDADLSLRLLQAGRTNWYVAEAELYHLEECDPQAASDAARRYDEHVHEALWGAALNELCDSPAAMAGWDPR